ncbi:Tricarboxylate transport protein TctC [Orrella dioscoreae]|uniref:Tricarboxylate transport protein TctC n=2 Tax=Orrella dioscoreae TaxID=1851544 RepID=A0A1C3K4C5_9BURK|nr:Tricarboxylate transport protein TctC [Orrella dioscoreae]SOE46512.1 Tricarboxylate transport protein TctC [Orrella dioscoreae]
MSFKKKGNFMSRITTWSRALLLATGLSLTFQSTAAAPDSFPASPIQLFVPFSAGGSIDVTARALGRALEKTLPGASVVVVNRPGGGGSIALGQVARAKPDGYTLGVFMPPNAVITPNMQSVNYDAKTDFSLIANYALTTLYVAVPADSPYKTLQDLLGDMQAEPGKVMFGITTLGSGTHLATARMLQEKGLSTEFVTYGGGAQVITALLGDQIKVATLAGEALPYVLSGKVRFLASFSAKKIEAIKDVPSIRDAGFDWDADVWTGLAAPKGLDEQVRKKLELAVEQATKDPEFIRAMESMAMIPQYLSGAALQTQFEESHETLPPLIKAAGLVQK